MTCFIDDLFKICHIYYDKKYHVFWWLIWSQWMLNFYLDGHFILVYIVTSFAIKSDKDYSSLKLKKLNSNLKALFGSIPM